MRQEKQHMLRCCPAFLQPALVPQSEASEGVIFSYVQVLWRILAPADALPRGPTYPSAGWLAGWASERAR